MIRDSVEAIIRALIPDETYLSPPVPTLKFGFPGFLLVTDSLFGSDDAISAPFQWILVDHKGGDLAVFARTEVVSPLPRWVPPSNVVKYSEMPIPEAVSMLNRFRSHIAESFFAGDDADPRERHEYALALLTLIPKGLRPWLTDCCRDFWDWAEHAE